jgi:hypothetical protein
VTAAKVAHVFSADVADVGSADVAHAAAEVGSADVAHATATEMSAHVSTASSVARIGVLYHRGGKKQAACDGGNCNYV